MSEFKSFFKTVKSQSCEICKYPTRLDTYGKGASIIARIAMQEAFLTSGECGIRNLLRWPTLRRLSAVLST